MVYTPDFRGTWIHPRIMELNNISQDAKSVWGAIFLTQTGNSCYKTDDQLADVINFNSSEIKKHIEILKKNGLLKIIKTIGNRRFMVPQLPHVKKGKTYKKLTP